jgi:octaprenyl-diphosphate synthase
MIKNKSASLFSTAAYCGASVANAKNYEVEALSSFGENIGLAYQLKDDVLDLTQKWKDSSNDLERGKITLPIIHAYKSSSLSEKKEIEDSIQAINNTSNGYSENIKNLCSLFEKKGSLHYCKMRIDEYLQKASDNLLLLRDTKYRTCLFDLIEKIKM